MPETREEASGERSGCGDSILAQLDAVERRLAQTQRLVTLGTLAAGVAHEINNILTPVLSYAYVLRSNRGDEALAEKAIEKIIGGVESACEVAQATLSYSKEDQEDSLADVAEVFEAALGCLARDPAKDRLQIVCKVPPSSYVSIRPLALQQVLLNLILNTRDALKGRDGTLTIEAHQERHQTRIVVSDTGPGIEPDVQARLFEPFVTTHAAGDAGGSTGITGGAGLGLTVSRHLIEKANGLISVSSEPGHGAVFTIVLPTGYPEHAKAG